MTYLSHRLPNGIRTIHKPTDALVAHCGLTINAGELKTVVMNPCIWL